MQAYAAAAAVLPATIDRTFRPLSGAGLIPRGQPGRGEPPPWMPTHHANVLMGLGAASPIEAADAAERLRPLPGTGRQVWVVQAPPQGRRKTFLVTESDLADTSRAETLGEWLERQISWLSDPRVRAGWTVEMGAAFELTLWPSPAAARVEWPLPDGGREVEWFGSDARTARAAGGGVRRSATIPAAVLLCAAEMWEATRTRLGIEAWPHAIP